jgi:cell division protein FtsN
MTSSNQRGGTLLGFILGLVVGLAVALAVAVYITKVPIPFMNKGLNRSADQDAAEEKKNKDWDPNAPLYGKNPARPSDKAESASAAGGKDAATKVDPKSADPIGDLAKAAESKPDVKAEAKADAKADNKADTKAGESGNDPFMYFVQAGAYRTNDEAEGQRVKLVMMGMDAKISERDQGGRTVYRVRVGPLQVKADAERMRDRLEAAHIDSALVRVQR